jgi:hypothetical protein
MWFQNLTRKAQLTVVGFLFSALYLTLLFTWTLATTPEHVRAALGSVGFAVADQILSELGLAAYLIPGFLCWWCYRLLASPSPRPLWIRSSLMLILLVSTSITFDLIAHKAEWNSYALSGLMGQDWGGLIRVQLGRTGGLIVLTMTLILCAFLSGKINMEELYIRVSIVIDAIRAGWKKVQHTTAEPVAVPPVLIQHQRFTELTGPFTAFRSRHGTAILKPLWGAGSLAVKEDAEEREDTQPGPDAPVIKEEAQEKPAKKSKKKKKESTGEHAADDAAVSAAPNVNTDKDEDAEAPTRAKEQTPTSALKNRFSPSVHFALPSHDLLSGSRKNTQKSLSSKEKQHSTEKLLTCLKGFDINGEIVDVIEGPRVVTYEFKPEKGVKLSRIQALSEDIALTLGKTTIRIVAPIPGRTTVGFEVPQEHESTISLKATLSESEKPMRRAHLPVILGRDLYGEPVCADLTSMPHLLVAGSTGSGKSIFINTLLMSLLYSKTPHEMELALVDPKMIEFGNYNDIPHLREKVIVNAEEAKDLLVRACGEMDIRYQRLSELGCRDIVSFNQTIKKSSKRVEEKRRGRSFDWTWTPMRYVVIVVDEMADLMMTQGKEVEIPLTRLAQKARACGIHLVLATQRPSSEVITGLIKTNFPSRIAFKVTSGLDSRTILDVSGAEKLLGRGDMLFMTPGSELTRYHSAFVSEEDVQHVAAFWRKQK